MYGREVFSLGADSYNTETCLRVRPVREPRIDLDISEEVPEVNVPVDWTPLKSAKMTKTRDEWEKPVWVYAHIWRRDVGTGQPTGTKKSLAAMIRDRGMAHKDECAYIVGEQIGGKMTKYNLFPQVACVECWKGNSILGRVIELLIKKWVTMFPPKCRPNVEFQMRLYYDDKLFPDRPSRFKYSVGFFMAENEGDQEKRLIALTKSAFRLSLKVLQVVEIGNVEIMRQEINKAIKEENLDRSAEHATAEILRLLLPKPEPPQLAIDPTLSSKLEVDKCSSLQDLFTQLGETQEKNADPLTTGQEQERDKDSMSESALWPQHERVQRSNEGQSTMGQKNGQIVNVDLGDTGQNTETVQPNNMDQGTMRQEEEGALENEIDQTTIGQHRERDQDNADEEEAQAIDTGHTPIGQDPAKVQDNVDQGTMRQEAEGAQESDVRQAAIGQDPERVQDNVDQEPMRQEEDEVRENDAVQAAIRQHRERVLVNVDDLWQERVQQDIVGELAAWQEQERDQQENPRQPPLGQQRRQRDHAPSILHSVPIVGPLKRLIEGCQDIADGNYERGVVCLARGGSNLVKDLSTWGIAAMAISWGTWVGTATGLIEPPKPRLFDFVYRLFNFK